MDLRQILLPTDFSEASAHAERFAQRLSQRFGATLTVVHVSPQGHDGAQSRADLLVLHGDPGTEIVREAHDRKTGLIVMPTHGHGTLRRFILGSVTAKVLHDAACPVLTTTHHSDKPELGETPFRQILCAVDLGPASANVLRTASALAAREGAKLTMVHMLPPQTMLGFTYYDPERWTKHAGAMLEKLQTETGVIAPWYVREGELAPGVNALAAETGADLLVIGRHPDRAVAEGRLRDQAYTLIRESCVPVLSV